MGFETILASHLVRQQEIWGERSVAEPKMEEEMIVKAIEEELPWDKLPKRLKVFCPSSEEWNKKYVLAAHQLHPSQSQKVECSRLSL